MNDPAVLKLRDIEAILLDVDGVLTNGSVILGPGGKEFKIFNVRDGHRIKLAKRGGIHVFFVTGRESSAVEARAAELGVDGAFQGIRDKIGILDEISAACGVPPSKMLYMGDDLVDLPIMNSVGVSACPNDAASELLKSADIVVDLPGGKGAAGRIIESVLKAKGIWEQLTHKYMK